MYLKKSGSAGWRRSLSEGDEPSIFLKIFSSVFHPDFLPVFET